MSTTWQEALQGKPWSFSAMIHSQSHVHDTDGRPLGEIRAPTQAKIDVPMVLRACPYRDSRRGYSMNVSALEQMTAHLDWVLHDVVAFRRASEKKLKSWDLMLAGILDQLSGPLRHLLSAGNGESRVPARLAVGHKLAAGYFGVVTQIIKQEAFGRHTQNHVEAFLSEIERQNALFGASEVCAGPPNLIRRCTAAWLAPDSALAAVLKPMENPPATPSEARVSVSHHLLEQVRLGLAFGAYDSAVEARFLRRWGPELDPHNSFIEKRLVLARMKAAEHPKLPDDAAARLLLRGEEANPARQALAALMNASFHGHAPTAAVKLYAALLRCRKGALRIENSAAVDVLAADIANYVECLRRLNQYQWELEMRVRTDLQLPLATPVKLGSLQRPLPAFLDWIEAMLGYKVVCEPTQRPAVTLRNHLNQESVPLFEGIAEAAALTAAS